MKTVKSIIACSTLFAGLLHADDPGSPRTHATMSENGRFLFLMMKPIIVTSSDYSPNTRKSKGVCYAVAGDGSLTENWRWAGVYSCNSVFLSDDGRKLIGIGPWNAGARPCESDLAVAFYDNGNLVKRYSTLDLLENPLRVDLSFSHYEWIDRESPIQFKEGKLHLKTTEGIAYTFDESGKLEKKIVPNLAKPRSLPEGFRTPSESLTTFQQALDSGDQRIARKHVVDFADDGNWEKEKDTFASMITKLLEERTKKSGEGNSIKILDEKISAECAVVRIVESARTDSTPIYFLKRHDGWKIVPPFSTWILTKIYQRQSVPVFEGLETWFNKRQKRD